MNGRIMIKQLAAACLLTGLTILPALAEDLPKDQIFVLACLENLEQSTTWGQCLNLMFQPCADNDVGSEAHVSCLTSERTRWRSSLENLQEQVFGAITVAGGGELADVMGQWTGYVAQKCQEVAASKVETGAQSARLGCEITEMVGLTGEFAACLEGRSTMAYCAFKQ